MIQAKSVKRQAEAKLRNAEESARVEIVQAMLDLRNDVDFRDVIWQADAAQR